MEEEKKIIILNSTNSGRLKMANKYVTRENMEKLFQLKRPLILDLSNEYEEISFPNSKPEDYFPILESSHNYMVISEDELEDSHEEEEEEEKFDSQNVERKRKEIFEKMEEERKRIERIESEKRAFIKKQYTPKHPSLYSFSWEFLDDEFIRFFNEFEECKTNEEKKEKVTSFFKKESETGIYSFPFLKQTFLLLLLDELEHFSSSGLPLAPPNTMNKYGLIIDEVHLSSLFSLSFPFSLLPFLFFLFFSSTFSKAPLSTHFNIQSHTYVSVCCL